MRNRNAARAMVGVVCALIGACSPNDAKEAPAECESCDIGPTRERIDIVHCTVHSDQLSYEIAENSWEGELVLEAAPGLAADSSPVPDGHWADSESWFGALSFPSTYVEGTPFAIRIEASALIVLYGEFVFVAEIDPSSDCLVQFDRVHVPVIDRRAVHTVLGVEYRLAGANVTTELNPARALTQLRLVSLPDELVDYELFAGETSLGQLSSGRAIVIEDGASFPRVRYAEESETGF